MTFPAELAFRRDRGLSATARRVYDYLTTILDFTEVRAVKSQAHAEFLAVERQSFAGALDTLAARGYLVEHPRDLRNVRRFTLAWSLSVEAAQ